MALLDLAVQAQLDCRVVHVNYQKRDSAHYDQTCVEAYCHKHHIPYHIVKAPAHQKGNFQAWARQVRYEAMVRIAHETDACGICVAHHQDDDLETYWMQKRRGSQVSWWGLQTESHYQGIRVMRPLLDLRKQDLIDHCLLNHIDYGLDETNDESIYTRNIIRKELALLSETQKATLLQEKSIDNQTKSRYMSTYAIPLSQTELSLKSYRELMLEWPEFLMEWLRNHQVKKELSHAYLEELHRQILHAHVIKSVVGSHRLIKQYGKLNLLPMSFEYAYPLESLQDMDGFHFAVSTTKGEAFDVESSDFPITIRSPKPQDRLENSADGKTLNRWFIEHKIPQKERETWPVVVNREGVVLFIPKCGFKQRLVPNKITCYMLK